MNESTIVNFDDVGRLPLPGDNVAIATHTLPEGTVIERGENRYSLSHTVLEGHRFACDTIPAGGNLLSWELPFGIASIDLRPGDYVTNEKMLTELRIRNLDFDLPDEPNFKDCRQEHVLNEDSFTPGAQVELLADSGTFQGFDRGPLRGSGTRNFIVVMGTTALTGSFAKRLAARFEDTSADHPNIDGVVAVAHTEGGSDETPNNLEIVLRTLAGFMIHPNVGAILAVDSGSGPIDNDALEAFLNSGDYPIGDVPHAFFRHERSLGEDLDRAEMTIRDWLSKVNEFERSDRPVSHLKLAMQCGGSDAFSGISGNPLSSEVAKEILRRGGSANLAETTELIGAENYVLNNVRDLETAKKFLDLIRRYDELAHWHGQSAEGNPSGGNLYRGLYNIVVKSIGAAMKKHPDVCLDRAIDYAVPMDEPGYYFMDSAGNDLESIAGQVACGCNVVHFITGNGSITNFPFVPTVKIVTTSGRYNLLSNEMDFDAGRYLEGESMERLAREAFDYTVEVASGLPSVGETAGHSQVQLWREWRQSSDGGAEAVLNAEPPNGQPIALSQPAGKTGDLDLTSPEFQIPAWETNHGPALERIGLIVPTSLCAGQIALSIADRLNADSIGGEIDRHVALPHTEGCGASRGYAEELFVRTMIGYLRHRCVAKALLLEHGCEKTHNDEFRVNLKNSGVDKSRFGWASIQNDGGIDAVTDKAIEWFRRAETMASESRRIDTNVGKLRIGLAAFGDIEHKTANALTAATRSVVNAGGSVILAQNASLLENKAFLDQLIPASVDLSRATLAYGQALEQEGLHLMDAPTRHVIETLSGLGGCGCDAILTLGDDVADLNHPMLPIVSLDPDSASANAILNRLVTTIQSLDSRELPPRQIADFQITRGWLGISL